MANLACKTFAAAEEYINIETELGITFILNDNYQIQLKSPATLCVAATQPTEGGFYIFDKKPFGYTHTGDSLWIKADPSNPIVTVNVAEG